MSTQSEAARAASDPVSAVGSLTQMIREECVVVDRTRAIPATVVDALRDAGVFHLLAPRAVGGAEIEPLTFLRVVEEVSYADGSAGWCTMIGGCYGIFGGMLPPEGAREIFGDPATISAGNFRPDKGVARSVDGGYRVSGRWELASGSSHAGWYIAGAMLVRDGEPLMGADGGRSCASFSSPRPRPGDRHVGLDGASRHRESRLRGARRLRARARTLWFQEPPSERGGGVPDAAGRDVRHLHRRRTARDRAPCHRRVRRARNDEDSDHVRDLLAERVTAQAAPGPGEALVLGTRIPRERPAESLGSSASRTSAHARRSWRLWLASAHAGHPRTRRSTCCTRRPGLAAVYTTSPLDRCLRDARTALQHVCTQEVHFDSPAGSRRDVTRSRASGRRLPRRREGDVMTVEARSEPCPRRKLDPDHAFEA